MFWFEYSEYGDLIRFFAPPNHYVRSISYDDMGRQTAISSYWVDPEGASGPIELVTSTEYDAEGRVTRTVDAQGHESLNTYTVAGQVAATTDINDHETQYLYDARGQLIQGRKRGHSTLLGLSRGKNGMRSSQTQAKK